MVCGRSARRIVFCAIARAAWVALLVSCCVVFVARAEDADRGPYDTRNKEWVDNVAPGFAAAACARTSRDGIVHGPYLQSAGSERVIVRWRTHEAGVGVVCYGTSPGAMSSVAYADPSSGDEGGEDGSTTEHVVSLSGLSPSTPYVYVVALAEPQRIASFSSSAEDDAMREFLWPDGKAAAPAAPTAPSLAVVPMRGYHGFSTFPAPLSRAPRAARVWAFGDPGWGNVKDEARQVREAFLEHAGGDWDLSLGLGDLAYDKGEDYEYHAHFLAPMQEALARAPLFTTPGNHGEPYPPFPSSVSPPRDASK